VLKFRLSKLKNEQILGLPQAEALLLHRLCEGCVKYVAFAPISSAPANSLH
jgi:hypothetical protein